MILVSIYSSIVNSNANAAQRTNANVRNNPMKLKTLVTTSIATALMTAAATVTAQTGVLNLYSSRHYQTDEALYSNFTKQTGIKLNRIEAGEDPLIERIRNEGAASPADVLVTVDAGRLWRAEQLGLFQPVTSKVLDTRLPANLHATSNQWFGFSTRARLIFVNAKRVDPKLVQITCAKPGYKLVARDRRVLRTSVNVPIETNCVLAPEAGKPTS